MEALHLIARLKMECRLLTQELKRLQSREEKNKRIVMEVEKLWDYYK